MKFVRTFLISILLLFPLIGFCQIDVPKWVDDIGGPNSNCISSAVGVDGQNNVYVTGFYNQTADFDPSSGVYNLTSIGGSFDTFVAKYTTNGNLVWAVSMGGTGTDQVNSMTVDASGNATIIGQFDSPSFTVTAGGKTVTLGNAGGNDAFIVKLNASGSLLWATSVGGNSTDYGSHVAADNNGNVFATVRYGSSVTVGGQTYTSHSGTFNALIIKYNPSGNVLWAINIADQVDSEGGFDAVDGSGNVVTCGHFGGNDNFNPLGTASYLNGNGSAIYVAKYNPSGILMWAQPIIGNVISNNANLCVNASGDTYVDGPFSTPISFNGQVVNPTGSQDIFLAKYNSSGVFQSAGDIGGGSIYNYGIIANNDNYIYISGYFSGTIDFDPSPTSVANVSYHGQQDFFLAKYDENLNYKWAFNGGNADCSSNLGRNVIIDGNNNVLFTGGFCSTVNFSASTCSPYPVTAQSYSRDCFLAKYVQSTASAQAQITGFSVPQQIQAATIDQTNLKITVTVPYGTNVTNLTPAIVYTNGYTVTPSSGTPHDFTGAVTYTLSNGCTTLNYTVNVVYSANQDTICSGSAEKLTGNPVSPAPTSYLWQIFQNNNWATASGTANGANYQTTSLINSTSSPITYSYRRQVVSQSDTSYDSYNNFVVIPATISNNTITPPAVSVFCSSGSPAAITGSTPAGGTGTYQYQWQSSADSLNFTAIAGATAINFTPPSTSSTIYYRRVVTSGTCNAPINSNVIAITVLTQPATPVVPAQTVCEGSAAVLAVSSPQSGVTYNWYDSASATNLIHTGPTFTTGQLNGDVTYYIDATNGQCTSQLAPVQVTVLPTPSAPLLTPDKITICSGENIEFTNSTPQIGINKWYTVPTGGTPLASGNEYSTGPLTSSITYYIEAVSNDGCSSATRTRADITVDPIPSAPQIQPPAPICSGSATGLQITNPQANLIYNWYSAATGGTPLYTGTQFDTPVLTTTTSYYVDATVDTGQCPSVRTSVQVTVNPTPAAPVVTNPAVSVCSGSSAMLAVNAPQAGLTYNWYDAAAAGTLQYTGTIFNTPALNNTVTYYVEAVSNTGGCTSTSRTGVTVTVNPLPAVPVPVNASVSVCAGSTASLSVLNPQTGIIYNWYDSPAKTNLLYTGTNYTTAAINSNATFYIEAVSGTCTSPSMGSVQVNIVALPPGPVISNPAIQTCYGSQVTLSIANPQTNLTYNWYAVASGGTPVATGPAFTVSDLTADITYYAETVNSTGCTSARTTANITVIPLPASPQAQTPVTICAGSSATINLTNTQTGITYNWYDAATAGTFLYSGTTYNTPVLNNAIIYYVEAVSNAGGCTSTSRTAVTVSVNQIPPVPVVAPASICAGNTAVLSVSNPQTGIIYNWYDSATKTNLLNTGTSYTTAILNGSTTYYIEALNGSCSSPSMGSAQVNVVPPPAAPVIDNINTICAGSSATLNVTNPQAGYTYSWYTLSSGGTAVATGSTYTTPALASNITYYAGATNSSGCTSPLTQVNISVSQIPDLSVTNASVCPGSSATLTASSATAVTINWYASASGSGVLASGNSFTTPDLSANTTYYAEAINPAGCTTPVRLPATVTMLQQLAAPVVTAGTTTSSSITFEWTAVDGATGYLVSIDNGATFSAPSSGSDGLSTTITGLQENESVTILVEATGAGQCQLSGSSTAVTAVAHDFTNNIIYVANAFTPNGDGKNDVIYVHSDNIKSMSFYVYDQWGEMLFRSDNQNVGWDGTYKGVKEPVGVYVYYVKAIMNDGQTITKKGTITLLR